MNELRVSSGSKYGRAKIENGKTIGIRTIKSHLKFLAGKISLPEEMFAPMVGGSFICQRLIKSLLDIGFVQRGGFFYMPKIITSLSIIGFQ